MKILIYVFVFLLSVLSSGFYFLYYPHIQTEAANYIVDENCSYLITFPSKSEMKNIGLQKSTLTLEGCLGEEYYNEYDFDMLKTDLANSSTEAYELKIVPVIASKVKSANVFYFQETDIDSILEVFEYTIIDLMPNEIKYDTSFPYSNYINNIKLNQKRTTVHQEVLVTVREFQDGKITVDFRFDNSDTNDLVQMKNNQLSQVLKNSKYTNLKN
jgi:hypothetical protein